MTQNMRKEPTFGTPSTAPESTSTAVENTQAKVAQTASSISSQKIALHSTQSPGHTFTPVMKRPTEAAPAQTAQNIEPKTATVASPKVEVTTNASTATNKTTGFAFNPVVETAEKPTQPAQPQEKTNATMNTSNERIIPTSAPTQTETAETAAKKPMTEKVPAKYRRLLAVLLLALALLLVFFLLKPKAPESVEALQEQGTSLPIEFRPVDEIEAQRAEEEARALAAQQAEQATEATQTESQPAPENAPTAASEAAPVAQAEQQSTSEQQSADNTQPVVIKPIVNEPIRKPEVSGSVIHQTESARPAPQAQRNTERLVKAEPKKEVARTETKKTERTTSSTQNTKAAASAPTASAAVSSKTLTVPKGVSLMQVFRNNNLNIADVNAMSKVNNAVGNLKAGQQVTVRLDKNGRVAEMSVGSGKYIRQTNGSYIFK